MEEVYRQIMLANKVNYLVLLMPKNNNLHRKIEAEDIKQHGLVLAARREL